MARRPVEKRVRRRLLPPPDPGPILSRNRRVEKMGEVEEVSEQTLVPPWDSVRLLQDGESEAVAAAIQEPAPRDHEFARRRRCVDERK